jgi:hypothetical protein
MHIVRDDQVMVPIDDLLIRLMRGLRAKRRIPNKAFKHDRAQRPPITLVTVSLLQENLGSDIIGRSDGGVCLRTKGDKKEREKIKLPFRWESETLTSFLRFAFQVAIWSLLDIVKWIAFTITLFLADCAALVGDATPLAESKRRW